MKHILYLIIFFGVSDVKASAFKSEIATELSRLALFSQSSFTYKDVAEAVNYCISKGEKQTVIGLIDIAWGDDDLYGDNEKKRFSVQERSFWVASILYKPLDEREKQSGYIKGLSMPEIKKKNLHFYYYPAVEIDGNYFIMASGMSGTGPMRSIVDYLSWCQRYGSFRKNAVKINAVVEEEVVNAYFAKSLWKEQFPEISSRENIEKYIKSQLIPAK